MKPLRSTVNPGLTIPEINLLYVRVKPRNHSILGMNSLLGGQAPQTPPLTHNITYNFHFRAIAYRFD